MSKLTALNFIILNGFYKDVSNDIRWHSHVEEEGGC